MRDEGKIAIVSDGMLDDLFFFMLPEKVKLISLAREREPEYGRELSEWVRSVGGVIPNAPQPVSNADSLSLKRQLDFR